MAIPDSTLEAVVKLISRHALTARKIAELSGYSKVHIYDVLKALKARGYKFDVRLVRDGATGPQSWAYRIISKP